MHDSSRHYTILDDALQRGCECIEAGALMEAFQAFNFVFQQCPHNPRVLDEFAALYMHEIPRHMGECLATTLFPFPAPQKKQKKNQVCPSGVPTTNPSTGGELLPLPHGLDVYQLIPELTHSTDTSLSGGILARDMYLCVAAHLIERAIASEEGKAVAERHWNLAEVYSEMFRFALEDPASFFFPHAPEYWHRAAAAYHKGLALAASMQSGDDARREEGSVNRSACEEVVEAWVALGELHLHFVHFIKANTEKVTLALTAGPWCSSQGWDMCIRALVATPLPAPLSVSGLMRTLLCLCQDCGEKALSYIVDQKRNAYLDRTEADDALSPGVVTVHRFLAWVTYEYSEWKQSCSSAVPHPDLSIPLRNERHRCVEETPAESMLEQAAHHAARAAAHLLGDTEITISEQHMPAFGTRLDLCRLLGRLGVYDTAWRLTLDLYLTDDTNLDVWELLSELRWRAGDTRHAINILRACLESLEVSSEEETKLWSSIAWLSQYLQDQEGVPKEEVAAWLKRPLDDGDPLHIPEEDE